MKIIIPLLNKCLNKYNRSIVNCLFSRLPRGSEIIAHKDIALNLLLVHRIHISIKTNPSLKFFHRSFSLSISSWSYF